MFDGRVDRFSDELQNWWLNKIIHGWVSKIGRLFHMSKGNRLSSIVDGAWINGPDHFLIHMTKGGDLSVGLGRV